MNRSRHVVRFTRSQRPDCGKWLLNAVCLSIYVRTDVRLGGAWMVTRILLVISIEELIRHMSVPDE
jgi:hypothetical protein